MEDEETEYKDWVSMRQIISDDEWKKIKQTRDNELRNSWTKSVWEKYRSPSSLDRNEAIENLTIKVLKEENAKLKSELARLAKLR
jgi:hypothetical protein